MERSQLILRENKDSDFWLGRDKTLQGKNWTEQILDLNKIDAAMTTDSDLISLIKDLDSRKRMYNGNNRLIGTSEKKRVLDEITGVRGPWRGENLDAYFFNLNGQWYKEADHRVKNGTIKATKVYEIQPLMKDGFTSFKYFDDHKIFTTLEGKEVYYFYPRGETVAWFYASSVRAGLGCDGNPNGSSSALGVRAKFLGLPEK